MKKFFILLWIVAASVSSVYADDDWGIDWAYETDSSDDFYYSYYPSDTKSYEQGYYVVSGYQNISIYEPVFIHIPATQPSHRDHPKPTPKPTPKPRTPKPEPKPTPKPEPVYPTPTPKKKKPHYEEPRETQEHREKRMEDEYYKTHTHFFPKHAVFDETLGKWVCGRWYIPDARHLLCVEVKVPTHATYRANERGWTCNRGYTLNSQKDGCIEVVVPKNATLNEAGNGWTCNKWYIKTSDGESCVAAKFPPHATKNIFSPVGWSCDFGYNMQEDYSCKK